MLLFIVLDTALCSFNGFDDRTSVAMLASRDYVDKKISEIVIPTPAPVPTESSGSYSPLMRFNIKSNSYDGCLIEDVGLATWKQKYEGHFAQISISFTDNKEETVNVIYNGIIKDNTSVEFYSASGDQYNFDFKYAGSGSDNFSLTVFYMEEMMGALMPFVVSEFVLNYFIVI